MTDLPTDLPSDSLTPDVERDLALAFAPIDKRAMGLAFGTALALLFVFTTGLAVVIDPTSRFPLYLLGQYFRGYTVSVSGMLIGGAWGLAVGFFLGWFAAFVRNLVLALWLMTIRIRNDVATQRDFLDHI